MMDEALNIMIVIIAGLVAGFFNTIAGGGSLISVPVLIFMGLPPTVANATNRVALVAQNISAVAGFRSKGVSNFPYSLWLGLAALPGAIVGAIVAVRIEGAIFNRILAVVMVLIVLYTLFKPKRAEGQEERTDRRSQLMGLIAFFFIGFYGGFIQAGVGFLMIAALGSIHRLSLVNINSIKVFVVLIYTLAALGTFIYNDVVHWYYGLILAVGNATGAWITARLSVKKGDAFVSRILLVTVTALAIKLWFF